MSISRHCCQHGVVFLDFLNYTGKNKFVELPVSARRQLTNGKKRLKRSSCLALASPWCAFDFLGDSLGEEFLVDYLFLLCRNLPQKLGGTLSKAQFPSTCLRHNDIMMTEYLRFTLLLEMDITARDCSRDPHLTPIQKTACLKFPSRSFQTHFVSGFLFLAVCSSHQLAEPLFQKAKLRLDNFNVLSGKDFPALTFQTFHL